MSNKFIHFMCMASNISLSREKNIEFVCKVRSKEKHVEIKKKTKIILK